MLAIPPYSIHSWNLYQKHPDAEQFKSDDDILLKQIQEINQHIHYINSTLGTRTPNFSTDIQHRINTSNKNSKKKPEINTIYNCTKTASTLQQI